MSGLRWWVVLASHDTEFCYECSGDNGRDFRIVAAPTAEAALEAADLTPRDVWDDPVFVAVYELSARPDPRQRRKLVIACPVGDMRYPRPAFDLIDTLVPPPLPSTAREVIDVVESL